MYINFWKDSNIQSCEKMQIASSHHSITISKVAKHLLEVGIYKRKFVRKKERKPDLDQGKSKIQEKRKKTRFRPRIKKENKILTKKTSQF